MKVGILTFHNVTNYGGVLQCYALQNCLQGLGHDCEVIDYHNEYFEKYYSPLFIEKRSLKKVLYMIYAFPQKWKRNRRFRQFRDKRLHISREKYTKENIHQADASYEAIISGSDQVWNLALTQRDTSYLLSFCEKARKISYAASFGFGEASERLAEVYAANLTGFACMSVREESAAKLVRQFTGVKPEVQIDPVFLLSEKEWKKLVVPERGLKNGNYICVYKINKSRAYELAKKWSDETFLPVYVIKPDRTCPRRFQRLRTASPEDFIAIIAHAKYVITDSFHGTAFSILFKRNFISCPDERKENRNIRIADMLHLFGLEQRMTADHIDRLTDNEDIKHIDAAIQRARAAGISYLENALA